LVTHSNMRAAVLCLNFPAWRSRIKRAPDKGNTTREQNACRRCNDWERRVRERVEDDRLKYAAAQRSDKRMFGSSRLALKHW
jgi:hypothetical protein